MKIIAIIPARAGSKGVKDKNIKLLNGKPLISYTISAAIDSGIFEEVMVSTDSKLYAEIAKTYGANVPFLRSCEKSSDVANSWDVVLEVINRYKEMGKEFDLVCLLQPTSPFRGSKEIIGAFKLFKDKKASSVISVGKTSEIPFFINTLNQNLSLDNFIDESYLKRRQDFPAYYKINGAIYFVKVNNILIKNIYNNSYAYVMSELKSIDIDNEVDFQLCELLLKSNKID